MNLIKLDATESTNQFLKALILEQDLPDFTVVSCQHQTKGRGQRGASWESESGKNLTFSILKKFDGLKATDQFKINVAISLAIFNVLTSKGLVKVFVKWPNDIMADNQKLCGILIENILQGSCISKSIIGIGLNVNQESFSSIGHATSIKLQCGEDFDLESLLLEIIAQVKIELNAMHHKSFYERYKSVLFKYNVPTIFIDQENKQFVGSIQGVEPEGRIKIRTEAGILRRFAFKEVKMVY